MWVNYKPAKKGWYIIRRDGETFPANWNESNEFWCGQDGKTFAHTDDVIWCDHTQEHHFVWVDIENAEKSFSNTFSNQAVIDFGMFTKEVNFLQTAIQNNNFLIGYVCINKPDFEFTNKMKLK